MRKRIIQFINEQFIKKNSTILVGVSGGPDSIALLHLLSSTRQQYDFRIIAVSIDHMLRGATSKADINYVESICEAWDIEFVPVQVDVQAYKQKNKIGTQLAARTLRYDVFAQQMKVYEADYLALGHHGDDQIETMLMSLTRTTSLSALTGIPIKRSFLHGEIIRPFLGITKDEIEIYCQTHQLKPRMDASNQDIAYTRNDIRLNVVPTLKKNNTNLHETIQLLSESLYEDEKYLVEVAQKAMKEFVCFNKKEQTVTFRVKKFNECSVSLQRRIYRLILNYLYEELPDQLSHIHEAIFLNLVSAETSNKTINFPKRLIMERAYDLVNIYYQSDTQPTRPLDILITEVPMTIQLANNAFLSATYTAKRVTTEANTYIFSASQVRFPLHIRHRKPGDRMSWHGLQGTKKLKDIFIDEKVPRKQRDEMFIVADDTDEIMWLIGLKKGKLQSDSKVTPFILLEYKV